MRPAERHSRALPAWQDALRRRQLILHYQPQRALRDGRVLGAEALLRWRHPEHGLLGPDAIVPAAERAHAIDELGRWVLEQACAQLACWRRTHADWTMAVNVSPLQLMDAGFVDFVLATLARHRLEPGALTLEITETFAVASEAELAVPLRRLSEHGVRLSLDDFGTGHSGLSRLLHWPIDELKIDRGFVAGLGRQPQAEAIITGILRLAADFDLAVVAEGIETAPQQWRLASLGCRIGQGYGLGHPLPPAQFAGDAWAA